MRSKNRQDLPRSGGRGIPRVYIVDISTLLLFTDGALEGPPTLPGRDQLTDQRGE